MPEWSRKKKTARYYNSNGFAVAIVAVINYEGEELFDWAAYIGGTDQTWHEQDAIDWVSDHGDKLPFGDAVHFFDLPRSKYRQ